MIRSEYLNKTRHSLPWLFRYPLDRTKSFLRAKAGGGTSLIFVIADHFEPAWKQDGSYDLDSQRRRVDSFCTLARKTGERVLDADGSKFRHTFFFPAEQYDRKILDSLASLHEEGLGEVEIHLHHGVEAPDTSENLRRSLVEFRDVLAEEHKCLARSDRDDVPMYAFVHGNLALGNSCGGRFCGVDDEMQILQETGCYVDMTLPTAPDQSQVRMLNQIYECGGHLSTPVPHQSGRNVSVSGGPPVLPLIFTGPLVLNWTPRLSRLLMPRIDDGALAGNQPMDLKRLDRWVSANVTVEGRPEWIFIKLYCHGFVDQDQAACIGDNALRFFSEVLEEGERSGEYRVYFASAREAYNMVIAAVEGKTGSPGDYRDFRLRTIRSERINFLQLAAAGGEGVQR